MELWRPVKNYEGLYEVSNLGRIKSLERYVEQWNGFQYIRTLHKEKILSFSKADRYRRCWLSKNGNKEKVSVHRIVAEAFCYNDDPKNKCEVEHKNGNTFDNRAKNLRWVTTSENQKYCQARINKYRRDKIKKKYGQDIPKKYNPNGKIKDLDTEIIFETSREAGDWLKKELNLSYNVSSNIRRSCRSGGIKSVYNHHYIYL